MKTLKLLTMVVTCLMAFSACSSDEDPGIDTTPTDVRIGLTAPTLPDDCTGDISLSDTKVTLTDINTNKELNFNVDGNERSILLRDVPGGYYRINVTGKLSYKNADLVTRTVDFVAYNELCGQVLRDFQQHRSCTLRRLVGHS